MTNQIDVHMSKAQNDKINYYHYLKGCAVAVPGGPWYLTFALGLQENIMFWITQVQGIGLSSIFLKTQPCHCLQLI